MAFDRTKPADTDYISSSAANLRENFRALAEDTRLYGTGAPESSAGQNGWRYVNTANGDEYLKVNNEWIKKTDFAALIRDLFVGAVSENEGVPTGAIIERGSNANGEYVKFADGTMVCTQQITLTNNGLSFAKTAASNWFALKIFTLPAEFIEPPKGVSASAKNDTGCGWASVRSASTSSLDIAIYDDMDRSGLALICSYTAVGRWY